MNEIENVTDERETASVMLKPRGMEHEHEIVPSLVDACDMTGLTIVWHDHFIFTLKEAFEFYKGHRGKWYRLPMARQIAGTVRHGFQVQGISAIKVLRKWVGPTDPAKAKAEEPDSERAIHGEGNMAELAKIRQVVDNAIHVGSSAVEAKREIAQMKMAANRLQRTPKHRH